MSFVFFLLLQFWWYLKNNGALADVCSFCLCLARSLNFFDERKILFTRNESKMYSSSAAPLPVASHLRCIICDGIVRNICATTGKLMVRHRTVRIRFAQSTSCIFQFGISISLINYTLVITLLRTESNPIKYINWYFRIIATHARAWCGKEWVTVCEVPRPIDFRIEFFFLFSAPNISDNDNTLTLIPETRNEMKKKKSATKKWKKERKAKIIDHGPLWLFAYIIIYTIIIINKKCWAKKNKKIKIKFLIWSQLQRVAVQALLATSGTCARARTLHTSYIYTGRHGACPLSIVHTRACVCVLFYVFDFSFLFLMALCHIYNVNDI